MKYNFLDSLALVLLSIFSAVKQTKIILKQNIKAVGLLD